MNTSRRLLGAVAVALVALAIGAATAAGQAAPTSASVTPSATGIATSGAVSSGIGTSDAVSTGIASPAWCCGATGETLGITTVGQASVDGQDAGSRDAAIAKAVQDATDQAGAAAGAAGIALGAIVDLQVSAAPFAYPMLEASTGSSPGSPGTGALEPVPYRSFVSVTITWSIG